MAAMTIQLLLYVSEYLMICAKYMMMTWYLWCDDIVIVVILVLHIFAISRPPLDLGAVRSTSRPPLDLGAVRSISRPPLDLRVVRSTSRPPLDLWAVRPTSERLARPRLRRVVRPLGRVVRPPGRVVRPPGKSCAEVARPTSVQAARPTSWQVVLPTSWQVARWFARPPVHRAARPPDRSSAELRLSPTFPTYGRSSRWVRPTFRLGRCSAYLEVERYKVRAANTYKVMLIMELATVDEWINSLVKLLKFNAVEEKSWQGARSAPDDLV